MSSKPLVASIREHTREKKRLDKLEALKRIAPPSTTQIAIVPPDRTYVEVPEVAAKKAKRRVRVADDVRAKAVARALKAQETKEETVADVAGAFGVSSTILYKWMQRARAEANGAAVAAGKAKPGKDIASVSKQLAVAMEEVTKLKKQLRKLLGTE